MGLTRSDIYSELVTEGQEQYTDDIYAKSQIVDALDEGKLDDAVLEAFSGVSNINIFDTNPGDFIRHVDELTKGVEVEDTEDVEAKLRKPVGAGAFDINKYLKPEFRSGQSAADLIRSIDFSDDVELEDDSSFVGGAIERGYLNDIGFVQATGGLLANAFNATSVGDWLMQKANANFEAAGKINPGEEGLDWLGATMLEQVPGIVFTLGSGMLAKAGVKMFGSTAIKSAMRKTLTDVAERQAAQELGKEVTDPAVKEIARSMVRDDVVDAVSKVGLRDAFLAGGVKTFKESAVQRARKLGFATKGFEDELTNITKMRLLRDVAENYGAPALGGVAFSYMTNTGDVYRDLVDEANERGLPEPTLGDVFLGGLAAASLDAVPGTYLMKKMGIIGSGDRLIADIVGKTKQMPKFRGLFKEVLAGVGKGASAEGLTEAVQGFASEVTKRIFLERFDALTQEERDEVMPWVLRDEALKRYGLEFVAGAATGGLLGGIGSPIAKSGEVARAEQAEAGEAQTVRLRKEALKDLIDKGWNLRDGSRLLESREAKEAKGTATTEPTLAETETFGTVEEQQADRKRKDDLMQQFNDYMGYGENQVTATLEEYVVGGETDNKLLDRAKQEFKDLTRELGGVDLDTLPKRGAKGFEKGNLGRGIDDLLKQVRRQAKVRQRIEDGTVFSIQDIIAPGRVPTPEENRAAVEAQEAREAEAQAEADAAAGKKTPEDRQAEAQKTQLTKLKRQETTAWKGNSTRRKRAYSRAANEVMRETREAGAEPDLTSFEFLDSALTRAQQILAEDVATQEEQAAAKKKEGGQPKKRKLKRTPFINQLFNSGDAGKAVVRRAESEIEESGVDPLSKEFPKAVQDRVKVLRGEQEATATDKAPVDQAPVDEQEATATDEAPVDEAPVDEAPVDEAPVTEPTPTETQLTEEQRGDVELLIDADFAKEDILEARGQRGGPELVAQAEAAVTDIEPDTPAYHIAVRDKINELKTQKPKKKEQKPREQKKFERATPIIVEEGTDIPAPQQQIDQSTIDLIDTKYENADDIFFAADAFIKATNPDINVASPEYTNALAAKALELANDPLIGREKGKIPKGVARTSEEVGEALTPRPEAREQLAKDMREASEERARAEQEAEIQREAELETIQEEEVDVPDLQGQVEKDVDEFIDDVKSGRIRLDKPNLSLANGEPNPAIGGRMNVDELLKYLDTQTPDFMRRLGKPILTTTKEFSEETGNTIPQNWEGAVYKDRIYLNVDNLTQDRLEKVLFHEGLGHLMTKEVLGPARYRAVMRTIVREMKALNAADKDIMIGGRSLKDLVIRYRKLYTPEGAEMTEAQEFRLAQEIFNTYIEAHTENKLKDRSIFNKIMDALRRFVSKFFNDRVGKSTIGELTLEDVNNEAQNLVQHARLNTLDVAKLRNKRRQPLEMTLKYDPEFVTQRGPALASEVVTSKPATEQSFSLDFNSSISRATVEDIETQIRLNDTDIQEITNENAQLQEKLVEFNQQLDEGAMSSDTHKSATEAIGRRLEANSEILAENNDKKAQLQEKLEKAKASPDGVLEIITPEATTPRPQFSLADNEFNKVPLEEQERIPLTPEQELRKDAAIEAFNRLKISIINNQDAMSSIETSRIVMDDIVAVLRDIARTEGLQLNTFPDMKSYADSIGLGRFVQAMKDANDKNIRELSEDREAEFQDIARTATPEEIASTIGARADLNLTLPEATELIQMIGNAVGREIKIFDDHEAFSIEYNKNTQKQVDTAGISGFYSPKSGVIGVKYTAPPTTGDAGGGTDLVGITMHEVTHSIFDDLPQTDQTEILKLVANATNNQSFTEIERQWGFFPTKFKRVMESIEQESPEFWDNAATDKLRETLSEAATSLIYEKPEFIRSLAQTPNQRNIIERMYDFIAQAIIDVKAALFNLPRGTDRRQELMNVADKLLADQIAKVKNEHVLMDKMEALINDTRHTHPRGEAIFRLTEMNLRETNLTEGSPEYTTRFYHELKYFEDAYDRDINEVVREVEDIQEEVSEEQNFEDYQAMNLQYDDTFEDTENTYNGRPYNVDYSISEMKPADMKDAERYWVKFIDKVDKTSREFGAKIPFAGEHFSAKQNVPSGLRQLLSSTQWLARKHPLLERIWRSFVKSTDAEHKLRGDLINQVLPFMSGNEQDVKAVEKVVIRGDKREEEYATANEAGLTQRQFEMYRDIRKSLDRSKDILIKDMEKAISVLETRFGNLEGTLPADQKKLVNKFKGSITSLRARKGYFPRVRPGKEFAVRYTEKDGTKVFKKIEEGGARGEFLRDELIKSLAREGIEAEPADVLAAFDVMTSEEMLDADRALNSIFDSPAAKDIPPEVRVLFKNALYAHGFQKHYKIQRTRRGGTREAFDTAEDLTDAERRELDVTAGFQEENLASVLMNYFGSLARHHTKQNLGEEVREAFEVTENGKPVLDPTKPQLYKAAREIVNAAQGGYDQLDTFVKRANVAAYHMWVAGRVSSAVHNMSHVHMFGAALLHSQQLEKTGRADNPLALGTHVLAAHRDAIAFMFAARKKKPGEKVTMADMARVIVPNGFKPNSDKSQADLDALNDYFGISQAQTISIQMYDQIAESDATKYKKVVRGWNKYKQMMSVFMHQSEISNRLASMLAHHRKFGDLEEASNFTNLLNANYSQANIPKLFRNNRVLQPMMFTFGTHVQNTAHLIGHLAKTDPVALAYGLGAATIIAGVPGHEVADKLWRWWYGEDMHSYIQETMGETVADAVRTGVIFPFFGADASRSLAFSAPPTIAGPVEFFIGQGEEHATIAPIRGMIQAAQGEAKLYKLLPFKSVQSFFQAFDDDVVVGRNKVLDATGKPMKLTLSERALTLAGFTPIRRGEATREIYSNYQVNKYWNTAARKVKDAIAEARTPAEKREARKMMREFNMELRKEKRKKHQRKVIKTRPVTIASVKRDRGYKQTEVEAR